MEAPARAVIFDFGGVLSLPLDAVGVAAMASLCNLSADVFWGAYARERLALDQGAISRDDYWRRILSVGGVEAGADLMERLSELDTRGWTRINERMLAWSRELRGAGVRTAILSNMPEFMHEMMERDGAFGWLSEFTPCLFSSTVGLVKPQPEIFGLCLEGLGLAAGDCLFIDDRAENVEAAANLGIRSLLFSDEAELARSVRDFLPVSRLGP
jgi:putative hydrolase of the HAD superfamily